MKFENFEPKVVEIFCVKFLEFWVKFFSGYNVSLIELAVCSGNCDLVRFLAKKNLPVEKSALILAIGNLDMCLTLLEHSTAIQTEILEGISAAQNWQKFFEKF